jgi:hypothetical protein
VGLVKIDSASWLVEYIKSLKPSSVFSGGEEVKIIVTWSAYFIASLSYLLAVDEVLLAIEL